MAQYPDAFGMAVTVENMAEARRFYGELYPHDRVLEGTFAGIPYLSIMRDGETLVNIFQKGDGNPLHDAFPILKVDSVTTYLKKIQALGGSVVVPESTCPCTSVPFAVVTDSTGHQLLIKEPRNPS